MVIRSLKEWIRAALIACLILYLLHSFAVELFTVSSSSMAESLHPGDVVLVDKISYGPRFPQTLLNVPFSAAGRFYLNWIQLPYWRLGKVSQINYDDIVIFNYPISDLPVDQKTPMVKRIMGLPGDTLSIKNQNVFVNNQSKSNNKESLLFEYEVFTKNEVDKSFFEDYGIHEGGRYLTDNRWRIFTTLKKEELLKDNSQIKSIKKVSLDKHNPDPSVFPHERGYHWNKNKFGPLVVPKKGDTIYLNHSNLAVYRRAIEIYEGKKLEVSKDHIYIDRVICNYFVPKLNYFFVMGDNRDNSADSRYWGFLPENHVIGKATIVLYSYDNSSTDTKVRWDRIFKSLSNE